MIVGFHKSARNLSLSTMRTVLIPNEVQMMEISTIAANAWHMYIVFAMRSIEQL